jgi:hypothetical protein
MMAEQKHTPGPWHAKLDSESDEADDYKVVRGDGYYPVASHMWEADARLIAAAPALLEALRSVVNAYGLDMQAAWVGMGRSGECHELVAARAAIAKAEGK